MDSNCDNNNNCESNGHNADEASGATESAQRCCQKSDIQSEDGQLVCVNCGQLIDRSLVQLRDDPTQTYAINCRADEVKSYVANNRHFPNRFPVAKRINTSLVETLAANLGLGSHIRDLAVSKYKKMVSGASGVFRYSSIPTKRVLSGLCLYLTLIDEKSPITIGHICNTIGCSTPDFHKVYTQVRKDYPEYRTELIPIESLVPVTLSEAKFADERKQIEQKVVEILDLCRECWLVEGRMPCHLIYAAAFMAWKTIRPFDRRKDGLTHFCRKVGIEWTHTTSERTTELFNVIKTLAKYSPFPSVQHSLKELKRNNMNIAFVLKDVLKYKHSLLFDLNQDLKRLERPNGPNGALNGEDLNDKSENWLNTFRRKSRHNQSSDTTAVVSTDGNNSDDISDTEIDSYIRTEREVKVIKKLKKIVPYMQ